MNGRNKKFLDNAFFLASASDLKHPLDRYPGDHHTGSLGKKIPRHNQENISKEAIAKDLEIDENIFEDDK